MTTSLAELPKGHRFPSASFELSLEWVAEYVEAVDDRAIAAAGAVPPMALAALSIRALLDQSPLPPGSIHVAQELSFKRAASVGEKLHTRAEIASRGERQGWVLMTVAHSVSDVSGGVVMDGRATITFPVDPGEEA
jgi:acyl dehydratase